MTKDDTSHRGEFVMDWSQERWRDPRARYEAYMEMDATAMTWRMDNTGEEGDTISKEALTLLLDHVRSYFGTRLVRQMNEGKQAKHFKLQMAVIFEGDEGYEDA